MSTAKLLNRSVVPKPSTGRMLLSAKTCRGCRSMPKAVKWNSAAFRLQNSTSEYMCLEIHQLSFKETSIVKGEAVLSHLWH